MFAIVVAGLLMMVVLWLEKDGILPFSAEEGMAMGAAVDSTRAFSKELFLTYLYPFEIASFLLLVAMIGSVVLARRGSATANSAEENEAG